MTCLALCALLVLQTGSSDEVRTVTFTVAGEKGAPVEGLTREELAVIENGVAREPIRVERDQRPLTLALILDSSEPSAGVFRLHLVDAVARFVTQLPESTRYSIWTTGDRPTKVVDYTDDKGQAGKALRRIMPIGGNTLLDAMIEVPRDLKDQEGYRTAVVVVTGLGVGFANYDRRTVVDRASKSSHLFAAVQFDEGRAGSGRDDEGQVGGMDYEYVLSSLTRSSGGLHETTLSAMGVDAALQRIAAALRSQYRLTYATVPDLKERKLEVSVARPGMKARVGRVRP